MTVAHRRPDEDEWVPPPWKTAAATTDTDVDAISKWFNYEKFKEQQQWLPFVSCKSVSNLDDPDRSVRWEQIENVLVDISGETGRIQLILDFLCWLGFPAIQCMVSNSTGQSSMDTWLFRRDPLQDTWLDWQGAMAINGMMVLQSTTCVSLAALTSIDRFMENSMSYRPFGQDYLGFVR